MGNPVLHFEVLGKDQAALQLFYAEAFGWQFKQQLPGYAMALPGAGINGGIGKAMNGGPGHVTFYIEVADVPQTLRAIEGLGGKTVMPFTAIPGGPAIAMFADPEGHAVGLVQAGSPGSEAQG